MKNYLIHYGILGQKWGKTNGPPYPLDYEAHSREEKRLAKKDAKWIKRHEASIKKKAFDKSEKEIREYVKELQRRSDSYLTNGRISKSYINNYNRKLADVMNKNVGDLQSPSGKVVRFVAKRGEFGVYTALADVGYDMRQVKNGVWSNARVGYKKETLGMIHSDFLGNGYLIHHGMKGQRHGVRNGPPYPLKRDSNGNVIKNHKVYGTITVIKSHNSTPPQGEPNSVVDHLDECGYFTARSFYDDDGKKTHDIHPRPHGNPKEHNYGGEGEHVTEYIWDDNFNLLKKTSRELTYLERKENSDIL